jgi:hypothetical protein
MNTQQQPALELFELSRIGRFRVMKHETFSPETQAEFRAAGIDPDTLYTVAYSYDDDASAMARLAVENLRNRNPFIAYRFYDAGEDEVIATSLGFIA